MMHTRQYPFGLRTAICLISMFLLGGCQPFLDRFGSGMGKSLHSGDPVPSDTPSWLPTTLPNPLDCGLSGAYEMLHAWRTQAPSVEEALDRINTAARMLDIGELVVQALPISAGSTWPEQLGTTVPPAAEHKIQAQLYREDPYLSQHFRSPLKIRAMYIQRLLFSSTPDLYFDRGASLGPPSEQNVQVLATKVLGADDNPAFHEVFYRLLLYNPEFTPRKELFSANYQGNPSEVYVNMAKAVIALAENKDDLIQAQEAVWTADEKKVKAKRDLEEVVSQIHQLRLEEYTQWFQQGGQSDKQQTSPFAKSLQELEEQYEIKEQEYEAVVAEYGQALEQLQVEYDHLREDRTALNPENQKLAQNIQTTIEDVDDIVCNAQLLGGVAGYHLRKALPKFDEELDTLTRMGQAGSRRVQRLYVNGKALPFNLKILVAEMNALTKVTGLYDGLFEHRIEPKKGRSFMDKLKQVLQ